MIDLKKAFQKDIIFISMSDGELRGCIFLKKNDQYIPIELSSDQLYPLNFYTNVITKLMEGETLYIKSQNIYLGHKTYEGPYGEDEYFISNYKGHGTVLADALTILDKNIFNETINREKLLKIGNFYQEERIKKKNMNCLEKIFNIALCDDNGNWKEAQKVGVNPSDDIFINRKNEDNITIGTTTNTSPALFNQSFDAFVFRSNKGFDEKEIAYFIDKAMSTNIYNDSNYVMIYYGEYQEEDKTVGKTIIMSSDGSACANYVSSELLSEKDLIDLATFKCAEYEQIISTKVAPTPKKTF